MLHYSAGSGHKTNRNGHTCMYIKSPNDAKTVFPRISAPTACAPNSGLLNVAAETELKRIFINCGSLMWGHFIL